MFLIEEIIDKEAFDTKYMIRFLSNQPSPRSILGNVGVRMRVPLRTSYNQKDLEKAIELNPNEPYLHWQRGSLYRLTGKYKEAFNEFIALDDFKPKCELDKLEQAEAHYDRAILNKMLEKHDEAATDLRKAIELNPKKEVKDIIDIKCLNIY
ncbi:18971_t:CDS:2 [Dentiscutata erythropus]|uniref:18971_t:CDS:1 n=1 Tax=Dentiscutata erythropus TaxID=1348616 RepID=A0A9N9DC10_9GLOM|nr:18971_t:CDS:2 [Dentiscutata erythropus]